MTLNDYFIIPGGYSLVVSAIAAAAWIIACLVRVVQYYTDTGAWVEPVADRISKPISNIWAVAQAIIIFQAVFVAQVIICAFFYAITWYIILVVGGITGTIYFIATSRRKKQLVFYKLKGDI